MTRPVSKGVRKGVATYYEDGLEQTKYCHTCIVPIRAGTPCYAKKVGEGTGASNTSTNTATKGSSWDLIRQLQKQN